MYGAKRMKYGSCKVFTTSVENLSKNRNKKYYTTISEGQSCCPSLGKNYLSLHSMFPPPSTAAILQLCSSSCCIWRILAAGNPKSCHSSSLTINLNWVGWCGARPQVLPSHTFVRSLEKYAEAILIRCGFQKAANTNPWILLFS